MKCPACNKTPENFREHALHHVRADEAYAIETWDHTEHKADLRLHAVTGPLGPNRIKELNRLLGKRQSLIYGARLRQIERRQRIRKHD
jgi:hypothetical protein